MSSDAQAGPIDPRLELCRRRERLAAEVQLLRSHLGGLVYEMAIRDHFRIDVLVARAAILQQRDAELGELERLLDTPSPSPPGAAGSCPDCGAVRSRGAVFCWQCGAALMHRVAGETIGQTASLTDARPPDEANSHALPVGDGRTHWRGALPDDRRSPWRGATGDDDGRAHA